MSLYYEDDYVQLHLGDCRAVRGWTGADVLVTDPPYGVAYSSGWVKKDRKIAGDHDPAVRDHVLAEWGDRPALVFGSWRVPRPANTLQRIVWDKDGDPGMGDLSMPWGNGDEEVYVLGRGWTGARRSNIIRCPKPPIATRPDHPTPKPVALMEALIERCPPGVIADPFAGSGATLIAARNLGRKAIGVEVEEKYCELIVSRLSQQAFDFSAMS